MYMVILCLGLFRIDELGLERFEKFVMAREPEKMVGLLSYVFDTAPDSPVRTSVFTSWCKHYDVTYVEEHMVAQVESLAPRMAVIVERLVVKAQGIVEKEEERKKKAGIRTLDKKKLTIPKGPNITKPRPRRVPEPMKITNDVKVGAEPHYLDRTSLKEIEDLKAERREEESDRTRLKYEKAKEQPFKFHRSLRDNKEEVRMEVEKARAEELKFDMSHRKPLPDFKRFNATVKLNTASILREDALFKKKQAEEAKLIKNYEEELRDSTEFYRWKTTMEEHDHIMKMEQVKSKRMQAEASSQNAREALERQLEDNKAVADLIKKEGELMDKQRKLEVDARFMVNKQLAKEIRVVEELAPRKAEGKIFRERQQIRKEMKVRSASEA